MPEEGTIKVLQFRCGEHLHSAALELAAAASKHGIARGKFNGVMIVARKASTALALISQFEKKSAAQSKRRSRTAAAKAQAAEWALYVKKQGERHRELMAQLPKLDFKDYVSILDWICGIEDTAAYAPAEERQFQLIGEIFVAHGYLPGANVGKDFNESDPDNSARYIIGQAVKDFRVGFAPHQIVHTFVAKWKKMHHKVH